VGPFGRDAEDCALVLSAICGHDLNDSTSLPEPVPDFHATLAQGVRGLRIGVPKEYFGEGVDAVVGDAVHAALGELRKLGASVEECSLPLTRFGLPVYYIIAPSECSANLARYDGVKYGLSDQEAPTMWEAMEQARRKGFGPEVRRRVMLGAYALSAGYYDAYYKKAQQVRTLMRQEFAQAFQRYDVLITPTSPTVAFKLGEKTADPVAMYKSDICTLPANMAGLPGMSIPCGFQGGLPIGLQIMGRVLDEATVLRAAYAYQQVTDWHTRRPGL
jgi:aspartyl-tRNA(Asn)/glutamyl-tRNA(Gln) amidotransferase subunit A